jgi:uncharacterized membrane protein YsdA (DUF1294 family)
MINRVYGMTDVLITNLLIVNSIAFALFGIDKHRAKRNQWRISEKTLIGIAVAFGSVGAIVGMLFFHHKTKHWYFRYGLPLILLIQVIAVVMLTMKAGVI